MLLLHLLLVLAAGEESSGLCSQHKHACCCMNVLLLPYSPSCRLPLLRPLLLPRLALLLLLLQPSCFFSGSTALRNTSSCFSVLLLGFSESNKQMRTANKSEKGSPLLPCWICPCPGSCFLFSPALDFLGNRLREKHGRRQRQRAAARPLCGERASRRPCGRAADRAAFYLTRSLPPSASSFERAPSAARTRQIRLIADSGKKAAKGAPGRPRRGLGYGLRVRSIQLPSRSATPCRRVPARAPPPEGRLR